MTDARGGGDKRTVESFKLYLFGGQGYAWEEWSTKFLLISSAKGVEDYILANTHKFFEVPTVEH